MIESAVTIARSEMIKYVGKHTHKYTIKNSSQMNRMNRKLHKSRFIFLRLKSFLCLFSLSHATFFTRIVLRNDDVKKEQKATEIEWIEIVIQQPYTYTFLFIIMIDYYLRWLDRCAGRNDLLIWFTVQITELQIASNYTYEAILALSVSNIYRQDTQRKRWRLSFWAALITFCFIRCHIGFLAKFKVLLVKTPIIIEDAWKR